MAYQTIIEYAPQREKLEELGREAGG